MINHVNSNERYFSTSSFYPAAFLFAKGEELVNVDKITDPRRASFVFENKNACSELLHAFHYSKENANDVLIDARKMVAAVKTLKEKLHQENF